MEMIIADAQKDMRDAYLGGGPGILISSIVWLTAGIVAVYNSDLSSLIVFFVGGMFIYPVSTLISKLLKRTGKHLKENPLGKLAIESTAILFIGLFISYSIFQSFPNWFYPIMLMIIGMRYLLFQSIYGLKIYWGIGLILITSGYMCLSTNQALHIGAIAGGVIELIFSIIIIISDRKEYV